jgi:hypothetical protein
MRVDQIDLQEGQRALFQQAKLIHSRPVDRADHESRSPPLSDSRLVPIECFDVSRILETWKFPGRETKHEHNDVFSRDTTTVQEHVFSSLTPVASRLRFILYPFAFILL